MPVWLEVVQQHSGIMLAIAHRTFAAYGFHASAQDVEDAVAEALKVARSSRARRTTR